MNKLIQFFILLVIFIWAFISFDYERVDAQESGVTKDIPFTLTTYAESLSDMEYWLFNPKDIQIDYRMVQNAGSGSADHTFNLGTQSDERAGCVQLSGTRRIGVCEDGNYKFVIQSTDAAGNRSGQSGYEIERDTVKPSIPTLIVLPDDLNKKILLKISGEVGSTIIINNRVYGTMPTSGSVTYTVVSSNSWEYGTKYVWKVILSDRAQNNSSAAYTEYTTPLPEIKSATSCLAAEGGKIAYPFEGTHSISSYFGWRDLNGDGVKESWHSGIDFPMPTGTNALSSEKGIVSGRSDNLEDGYGILVHHPEIGISTVYWHFDKNYVKVGHSVERGMILGLSGNTGFSTGPHLHFAVKAGGININPLEWLGDCIDQDNNDQGNNDNSDIESIFERKEKEVFSEFKAEDGDNGKIHRWCDMWIKDYDYYELNSNGRQYYYGWIMYKEGAKPYFVLDYIGWTYWNNGGCDYFGYPTMDSRRTGGNNGWYQAFSKNSKTFDIHWHDNSAKAQGKWVTGGLRDHYRGLGGSQSYLQFPTNNEKPAKSSCGRDGWHQEFEHGKEYFSSVGVADWEYGGGLFNYQADTIAYYWRLGEMSGKMGWPKSGSYRKSTDIVYLENGRIYQTGLFDTHVSHEVFGGCSDDSQRKNDPDNTAARLIQDKEDSYPSYQRVNGGNGNGAIHQWICDGNTMWLADYDKVGDFGNSVIIANEGLNKAFLVTGEIWHKYRDNNGCSVMKKPTADQSDTGVYKNYLWTKGTSLRQSFESGDVYSYDTFNLIGQKTRHTYMIYGNIKTRYDSSNGINGNYKFLKSDRYSYSENDVNTMCQDSEGGRICESDIPKLTDEQIKLGELLGRFVKTSEIIDKCGLRIVIVNGGIAYYDNGSVGKVTGKIYSEWETKCSTYGKPIGSTQGVSSYEKNGQFQKFSFNNWEKTYEIYNSDYGLVILEGINRDMYKKYGFNSLGFPKTSVVKETQSVCPKDTKIGKYLDIQRGRIYKSDYGTFWVKGGGQNEVEKYFWSNGAHGKFGLPKGDEETGGLFGSALRQQFELTTIYDRMFGGAKTDPEDIYCPGEEPVEPTPTPTLTPEQPVCVDGQVWDGGKCVAKGVNNCPKGFHPNEANRCVRDFLNSVHPVAQDAACVNIDILYTGAPEANDDFGWRDLNQVPNDGPNKDGFESFHSGVDVRSMNDGSDCKINAMASGEVIYSGNDGTGAQMIEVEHNDTYTTRYLHGKKGTLASEGKQVGISDYVFTMGNTGAQSIGRHLHLTLLKNGAEVDPQASEHFGYLGQSFTYFRNNVFYDGVLYNTTKIY